MFMFKTQQSYSLSDSRFQIASTCSHIILGSKGQELKTIWAEQGHTRDLL